MGGIIEISSDEESEVQEPVVQPRAARPTLIITDTQGVPPAFRTAKVEPSEKPRNAAKMFNWGDPLPAPNAAPSRIGEGQRTPAPLPKAVVCKTDPDEVRPKSPPLYTMPRPGKGYTPEQPGPSNGAAEEHQRKSSDAAMEQEKTASGGPAAGGAAATVSATPSVVVNDDVCRHFWRAGEYEAHHTVAKSSRGPIDHVRVHPKFLHSNATSHKWALGAVAELLDNAVDEVQNGATFVKVDKIDNPRDQSAALLVHDNGGGMDPACMRQCMSLGYSGKNTNTTIGQYGNGFKTSTMRLGADVIVISRSVKGSVATQSVGLLSYTYLRKTGMEDVVVPMVDYQVSPSVGSGGDACPQKMLRGTVEDWQSNLSTITEWSPFKTEKELLDQCDSLGRHGTKVIIYNLWLNDDGILELDFNVDPTDIQLRGGMKVEKAKPANSQLAQNHIANQYHHSLRTYISILYLRMPDNFKIYLRGVAVEHHRLEKDLKFEEQIVYKPLIANRPVGVKETTVVTTIGFTKEAPLVNVHGFNVYHKNRLIIPFWKVWQDNSSRGRGVVGVLEANFVEPAHDKQDFERTAVLVRLEGRLKQMTVEYWNTHCHLIGYQAHSKQGMGKRPVPTPADYTTGPAAAESSPRPPNAVASSSMQAEQSGREDSVVPRRPRSGSAAQGSGSYVKSEPVDSSQVSQGLGSEDATGEGMQRLKRQRVAGDSASMGSDGGALVVQPTPNDVLMIDLIQENTMLRTKVTEYEQERVRLNETVVRLQTELAEVRSRTSRAQQTRPVDLSNGAR